MRCPTLTELPPPPKGKTGWPWTEVSEQLPGTMPDGTPWPRISIVTPSYNQGEFIEETIRSILLQGYPDLEYIIIDGGSMDESVEIIEKYSAWLKHWVSEPDRGQSHAINKGRMHTTGTIEAYLNSDDFYDSNILFYVATTYEKYSWSLFVGRQLRYKDILCKSVKSRIKKKLNILPPPFLPGAKKKVYGISQESTFWDLKKYKNKIFDESLNFCLDVDWYCQLAPSSIIMLTSREVGLFRIHENSKSSNLKDLCHNEHMLIKKKYSAYRVSAIDSWRIWILSRLAVMFFIFFKKTNGDVEFLYDCPTKSKR